MNRSLVALASVVMLALLNLGGDCENHDMPNRIPQLADMVREGHGKLKWTADMPGMIYVYDSDKKTVRYEGDVQRGEQVVVHPEEDRVYVAGHVVYDQNMEKHNWHKIYFVSDKNLERTAP